MSKLKPNQFTLPSGAVITEIPLLFQTEMVQANLEDRKTQTRRTSGLQNFNVDPDFWNRRGNPKQNKVRLWDSSKEIDPNPLSISFGFRDQIGSIHYVKSPYGKPGDLLWVRETWGYTAFDDEENTNSVLYKADYNESHKAVKALSSELWKPSIHMPKAASRIWAMVEEIRVERVQDITEEDAKAEGVDNWTWKNMAEPQNWMDYTDPNSPPLLCAQDSFNSLWISINGEESFDQNPWVWVVKYRILSKTGRPSMQVIEQHHDEIVNATLSPLGAGGRGSVRKEASNV